jgi:hypothetical protein
MKPPDAVAKAVESTLNNLLTAINPMLHPNTAMHMRTVMRPVVALALEEAAEVSENRAAERARRIAAQAVTIEELRAALRASEAAVESLTGERDAIRKLYNGVHDNLLRANLALEAARAEATKAERERIVKIIEGGRFLTSDSPEVQWARAVVRLIRDDYAPEPRCTGSKQTRTEDMDVCDDTACPRHAAIRAPRQPEPEKPNPIGALGDPWCDDCKGYSHTDDCPSSPTPPSEKPRYNPQFDKCSAFCSFFVTGFHVEGCKDFPEPPTHEQVAGPPCKNCGFTLGAHFDGWCPNQIGGTRYTT